MASTAAVLENIRVLNGITFRVFFVREHDNAFAVFFVRPVFHKDFIRRIRVRENIRIHMDKKNQHRDNHDYL